MKTLIANLLMVLLPFFLYSQVPYSFNYQSEIRGADNKLLVNQDFIFLVELIHGLTDTVVYAEEHDVNTGSLGKVNFKVGLGEVQFSDFATIDWSLGNYLLRISLDGIVMGQSTIVAVPFAMYAQKSADSYWKKEGTDIFYNDGRVGLGIKLPEQPFHLHTKKSNEGLRLTSQGNNAFLNLHLANNVFGQYSVIDMGGGTKLRGNGVASTFMGQLGIGTDSPKKQLHLFGDGFIQLQQKNMPNGEWGELNATAAGTLRLYAHDNEGFGGIDVLANGNVGLGTYKPKSKLHVNGTTTTKILQITGGADIKEDFNSIEPLTPGEVVVIDENIPGNLKRTRKAYDRKVAGVISGANGIQSGLSLSQENRLEGAYPLTLLGRVYVKVVGRVEVGDMLTTSTIAGHAMAVQNRRKANGSVIGKAMSENKEGQGLVLVLVNVQ